MKYQWDSFLETGNENIDSQHKQLVSALKNLVEACQSGTGKAELARTIDFLLAYTVKHFADEEALQVQYKYDDYLRHKQIHEAFTAVALDLAKRLQDEGPTVALLAEVHSSMGEWLIKHIKGEDSRLAEFIKNQTQG